MKLIRTIFALLICTSSSFSMADPSGPLGLDHRLDRDTSGIWADSNQKAVEYGSAQLLLGGAFYEGNTTRIGKTLWQSVDAMLLGDVSAAAGKAVFRRQRPIDGNDPNAFFKSGTDNSFCPIEARTGHRSPSSGVSRSGCSVASFGSGGKRRIRSIS